MRTYLYLLTCRGEQLNKVGITCDQNLIGRFRQIQTSCPYDLVFIDAWEFATHEEAAKMEALVLEYFASHRTAGEWVKCSFNEARLAIDWLLRRSGYGSINVNYADSEAGHDIDWVRLGLWQFRKRHPGWEACA